MSSDERGLVTSNLGDMHFNSRLAVAQTVTQAVHIEVKPRQGFGLLSSCVEGSGSGCLPKLTLFLFQTFLASVGEERDLVGPRSIRMDFKDFNFFLCV